MARWAVQRWNDGMNILNKSTNYWNRVAAWNDWAVAAATCDPDIAERFRPPKTNHPWRRIDALRRAMVQAQQVRLASRSQPEQ